MQLAVNTSVAESTGYSPAFITQGREPRLPNALFDEKTTGTEKCIQTPGENAEKLKEIFELVRRNVEKAAQDQARHYSLRRRPWRPKVRDTVWAKEHPLSKAAEGFAAKLAPRFYGPYTIKKFTSPVICVLEHETTKKEKTAHISDLKPGSADADRPGDFEE
ncbi:GM26753 [Drosophila sechellia]|uniref:GM26753 n=1 Tax=Drosophila sechellia TaxID=7238 RepID=B4IN94_DROSE|nr:GM26753 [Drosophila sechellia]